MPTNATLAKNALVAYHAAGSDFLWVHRGVVERCSVVSVGASGAKIRLLANGSEVDILFADGKVWRSFNDTTWAILRV